MPDALMIGVSEEVFWTLNPNRLTPYVKASEKREEKLAKDMDLFSWLIGRYCCEATGVALSNAFGKKKMEYSKKPATLMNENSNEDKYANLSEEEKLIEVQHIFSQLTAVESRIQKGGE